MNLKKTLSIALLLFAAFPALADENAVSLNGQPISLEANKQPVDTPENPAALAALPKDFHFVKPGYFTVAVLAHNSPPLFVYADDNKTLLGSEVDMARLIADSLGLKLNIVPTSWEDWPLGVIAGKYDAAITNVTVTQARKAKFDFATYRRDTLGFYVKKDSPITSISKPEDIAGLRIIVTSGTNQEAVLLAWDKQNQAKGLKPFTPVYSRDEAMLNLTLQSGRADAYFGPNVIGAWKAALTGTTHLVGSVAGGWPKTAHIGAAVKKDSGLVNAVNVALNGVIQNGDYLKVLNRWGEGIEKIDRSEINPPGLGD